MAISNTQKDALNKMCGYAKSVGLGTVIQDAQTNIANLTTLAVKAGKYTVTSANQTAGTLTINTGITINGFIVQVYRNNNLVGSAKVTAATTNLTVATNSTDYVVTTGDVINYIVF